LAKPRAESRRAIRVDGKIIQHRNPSPYPSQFWDISQGGGPENGVGKQQRASKAGGGQGP
jgi:predicted DNA binding CopG/RHH family protein